MISYRQADFQEFLKKKREKWIWVRVPGTWSKEMEDFGFSVGEAYFDNDAPLELQAAASNFVDENLHKIFQEENFVFEPMVGAVNAYGIDTMDKADDMISRVIVKMNALDNVTDAELEEGDTENDDFGNPSHWSGDFSFLYTPNPS